MPFPALTLACPLAHAVRFRTPRTSCSSPPPTCTAMPPTGTTCANKPFAGGMARVATVVDSLKARYPGQVVVVDAGDLMQGDPFATYFARVTPHDPHPRDRGDEPHRLRRRHPGQPRVRLGPRPHAAGDLRRGLSLCQRQHLHPGGRHAAVSALCGAAAEGFGSGLPASPRRARWCGTGTSSRASSGSIGFRPRQRE